MKLKNVLLFSFFLFSLQFAFLKRALAADPHLFLSPTSGNYSSGFSLEVKVDTGGQAVGGVDVYLEFPKNLLKVESVDKGIAFPEVYSLIKNDEGKLRINAYFPFTQAGNSFNGSAGLVAKINFTPLNSGAAEVKFICTPKTPPDTTDCNIVEKAEVKDIIVCASNVNGSYTVSSGGETQSTPTPTPTGVPGQSTPTPTPTPTLPTPGSTVQILGFLGLGIFFLLTGLVLAF